MLLGYVIQVRRFDTRTKNYLRTERRNTSLRRPPYGNLRKKHRVPLSFLRCAKPSPRISCSESYLK